MAAPSPYLLVPLVASLAGCLSAPHPLVLPPDGPAPDAPAIDAAAPDAAPPDGPAPDGPAPDARPDAVIADARPVDATAPDAPSPDAPPLAAQYTFETGAHGFTTLSGGSASRSSDRAFGGTTSLQVALSLAGAGESTVYTGTSPMPGAGDVVTFHIWVPSGASITSVQPFVQASGGLYPWISQAWVVPDPYDAWLTVTLPAVPSGYTTWRVGVQINTSAASSGAVYLDEIGWP